MSSFFTCSAKESRPLPNTRIAASAQAVRRIDDIGVGERHRRALEAFVVTVEASIRQLRWWLKRAGRGYGVRVIDLREAEHQVPSTGNLKSRGRP